jgi:hypothetical protein
MGYALKTREIEYAAGNPEWERLNDLLGLVQAAAPGLAEAFDAAANSGPTAWSGGRVDEVLARVRALRGQAQSAAETAVGAVRRARDAQPRTVLRTCSETYSVWEPDLA